MAASSLSNLFNTPSSSSIGGVLLSVTKLRFEQFDDVLTIEPWISSIGDTTLLDWLGQLKDDPELRACLDRLLAGCLWLPTGADEPTDSPTLRQLNPADVQQMPLLMVAEAVAVVMEVNADFFSQTLGRIAAVARRMGPIGSELLSSLSAQGILSTPSGDTASPSSEAS